MWLRSQTRIASSFFAALLLTLFSPFSLAEEIIDVDIEVASASSSTNAAKKEMFQSATEQMSEKYIKQIIGEEKFKRNQRLIKNKIIRNSRKFILYTKASGFKKTGSGSQMNVAMKVSLKNLKTMLLNEGLFYKTDGPPKVLPLIGFVDRFKLGSFSWWVTQPHSSKQMLLKMSQSLHRSLAEQLYRRGFYSFKPVEHSFRSTVPSAFQVENLQTIDYLFLGQLYKASIVLRGDLVLQSNTKTGRPELRARIQALHSSNGRTVGEVVRNYQFPDEDLDRTLRRQVLLTSDQLAESLADQLHEAWKRGTFGADLIQLTLKGKLKYNQLRQFKDLILSKVKDIKSIKERLFEPGQVTYEVDSLSSVKKLAQSFESEEFPRFKVKVHAVAADKLDLELKAW